MNPIHWLSDGPAGRDLLGGKGENLAILVAAGFDVPDGFVVTTEATAGAERGAPQFAAALTEALERLAASGEPVAVRSSATAEDAAGASFAGQFQTVLDVRGVEACRLAIDACVESMESAGVAAYLQRLPWANAPRMAVVVQRYVEARAAGVAFSIDPADAGARVVVEAVAGRGDALVGGMVAGERLVLDRQELRVTERSSADPPVLSDAEGVAVASLALRAEEHFGAPQDIEFAIDHEGRLWLLQSRPVTAAGQGKAGTGWPSEFDTPTSAPDAWTSANIQEVLPGLLTPFSMSLGATSSQLAFVEGYRKLGLIGRDENPLWIGFFYNRAYLHVGTTRLIAERAIAGSSDAVEQQYLGGEASVDLPSGSLRERLPFMARSLGPLLRMTLTAGKRTGRIERMVLAEERRRRDLAVQGLSPGDILDLIENGTALNGEVLGHHLQVSGLAGAAYTNLERVLRPVTGDETERTMAVLLGGLQNVESARIGADIWRLSRVALACGMGPRLAEAGFDPWREDLPDGWRAGFRSFIRAHGHRGMREMEASARSWRADPAPVLSTVRRFLEVDPGDSPLATLERQVVEREAKTQEVRSRMSFARRPLFRRFLADAQAQVAQRERTKSIVVRAARMSDHILAEVARRAAAASLVESPDDLFFLTYAEVLGFLRGDVAKRQDRVARRRREFERNRYIELPERFRGHPEPLPPVAPDDAESLSGIGVSAGAVTGRARVIRDPAIDGSLEPGEILVAPVTDAGWTPLFGLASGVVVDIGSALSHGSTVAREYGLPAVVNVKHGTRLIRTGDLVTVDGAAGRVTIVERASPLS